MPILQRLVERFRPPDLQIDKELQFHIDEQMAVHMAAGLSPAEAARRMPARQPHFRRKLAATSRRQHASS